VRTAVFLLLASGCAAVIPALRDPAREAEEKERTACAANAPYPDGLFDPRSVVRVEPIYTTVRSGRSGSETHLLGARMTLRRFPGVTAEDLEALLDCHNARSELGRSGEPVIDGDPYWVQSRLLEITVHTERGAPVVEIKGIDFAVAKEVLRRANAFVERGLQTG
jgi:hypothetical protein